MPWTLTLLAHLDTVRYWAEFRGRGQIENASSNAAAAVAADAADADRQANCI